MNIWIATMRFPSPTETFAGLEVLELHHQGHQVSIQSLRRVPKSFASLKAERGLLSISTKCPSWKTPLRCLAAVVSSPSYLVAAISFCARSCGGRFGHLAKALWLIPRAIEILTDVQREKPDVLHLYWGHYPSLLGHLVRRFVKDTQVTMFLGAYDLETEFPGSFALARQVDRVFTHCHVNRSRLIERGIGEEKLEVIHRGTVIPEAKPLTKDRSLLLSVGKLVDGKGMDDVLWAFRIIHREHPDTRLCIVGEGPARRRLQKLCRRMGLTGVVTFTGQLPHSQVLSLMERSFIFLSMSRKKSERLPNVLKEAMVRKNMCIATRTLGIDELLRDGEHGRLVEQRDFRLAAQYACSFLIDHESQMPIVAAASERVRQRFDVRQAMTRQIGVWKGAIQETEAVKIPAMIGSYPPKGRAAPPVRIEIAKPGSEEPPKLWLNA